LIAAVLGLLELLELLEILVLLEITRDYCMVTGDYYTGLLGIMI